MLRPLPAISPCQRLQTATRSPRGCRKAATGPIYPESCPNHRPPFATRRPFRCCNATPSVDSGLALLPDCHRRPYDWRHCVRHRPVQPQLPSLPRHGQELERANQGLGVASRYTHGVRGVRVRKERSCRQPVGAAAEVSWASGAHSEITARSGLGLLPRLRPCYRPHLVRHVNQLLHEVPLGSGVFGFQNALARSWRYGHTPYPNGTGRTVSLGRRSRERRGRRLPSVLTTHGWTSGAE